MDLITTQQGIAEQEEFQKSLVELALLEYDIKSIKVVDEESYAVASEQLLRAKKHVKALNEMRLYATKPARDFADGINAFFKEYTGKFERKGGLLGILNDKMVDYKAKQMKEAMAEQERAARAQITAEGIDETAVKAEMLTPSTVLEVDSGKTYLKDDLQVEIIDMVKFVKSVGDGRNTIPMREYYERWEEVSMPLLRQHVRSEMYSEAKWRKYGVRVVKKKKIATRS
jgi:predicted  nucleic acid-binding Zn-ribbon protein